MAALTVSEFARRIVLRANQVTLRPTVFLNPQEVAGKTDLAQFGKADSPPTSRGRRARLRRVTFDVFAQFLHLHTMNV